MNTRSYEDRIKGSFYGFAIGDAMGATTEFMTTENIKIKYGKVSNIIGGGWLNLKPGEVTDDTQMMLCVFNALKKSNGDIDKFLTNCCENFIKWYCSNPVDIGGQCAKIISKFSNWIIDKNFNNWFSAANDIKALGNGGLMRALPAALYNKNFAIAQSNLTHNNFICQNNVDNYCDIIAAILDGKTKYEIMKSTRLGAIKERPSGNVYFTLNNAMYWFIHTNSFEDCIVGCVNDGGDADTIAAIAGSLAGLFYGYESINKSWINQFNKNVKKKLDIAVNWFVNCKPKLDK